MYFLQKAQIHLFPIYFLHRRLFPKTKRKAGQGSLHLQFCIQVVERLDRNIESGNGLEKWTIDVADEVLRPHFEIELDPFLTVRNAILDGRPFEHDNETWIIAPFQSERQTPRRCQFPEERTSCIRR